MSSGFEQLAVWKQATALAVGIYSLCRTGELSKDPSLRDQMQRAAISIASNIAEGDERGSNKDSIRFFYIARASSAELYTKLFIAHAVGVISARNFDEFAAQSKSISRQLYKLIQARSATS